MWPTPGSTTSSAPRHRGGQGLGMNVGRNDVIEVAGDHRRDGDGPVARRLRRHEALELREVLAEAVNSEGRNISSAPVCAK